LTVPALRSIPAARPTSRWRHGIVGVDDLGRITLPADFRTGLDVPDPFRAVSRENALRLRRGPDGTVIHVDRRGRLVLPMWLRRLADPSRSVFIAARWPEVSCLVVMPTSSLDALVDVAAEEVG